MTVIGLRHDYRCVVCGACAVVIVRRTSLPEVELCYCSHDWLAVELDGLAPDTVISWVNDEPFPTGCLFLPAASG